MKNFIKINDVRLKTNTIKKYLPIGKTIIGIYYSVSRYKIDKEEFKFDTEKSRNIMINILDEIL